MGRNNPINLLKGFAAAKCLTALNLTIARIKVTRNRRNLAARQIREEIAQLFRSGQAANVYDTKIAILIREENTVAAYALIDHYCHSIVSRFPILETQRHCPPELKEPIASLIYAAPRCTDLPELTEVKDMLITKYGKEFAIAANEIKPDCGVSRDIIELLSMHPPSGQIKVKLMKDICLQNNIEWRSEWAPEASITPIDNKRNEMDESSMRVQTAPSSIRPLKVGQDMKPHDNRISMHGEGLIFKEQEAKANTRVSNGMVEASYPAVGSGRASLPREEILKVNIKISEEMREPYKPGTGLKCENANDPYKSALPRYNPTQGTFPIDKPDSPGYNPKQGYFLRDESKRSNLRVSDSMHHPRAYGPGFGSPLGDEATRANIKIGANEPSKPAFSPMNRKEAARDNGKVFDGMEEIYKRGLNRKDDSFLKEEHEPGKPIAASFGCRKVADYKEATREDRAEYIMQHPDEISDSGSDIFVSVEDDDVALFHKEGASRASGMSRGTKEDNSNANFTGRSTRETGLGREGYLRDNSQGGHKENSRHTNLSPYQKPTTNGTKGDEEQSLKANQRSRKASNSNHWEQPQKRSSEPEIASAVPWVEKVIQGSAASSPHLSDPLNEDEFASTAKAIAAEAARLAVLNYAKEYSRSRSTPKDVGDLTLEKTEDNLSHSRQMGSDIDDDDSGDPRKEGNGYNFSKPTKTTHNETANANSKLYAANTSSGGKINADRPAFSRAHAQFYKRGAGSFDADAFMRPVFDDEQDFTDERAHRRKHSEGISDPEKQQRLSSNIKAGKLYPPEHDPYFDGLTREEELTHSNQMSQETSKSHTSTRPPHDEYHEDKRALSTGDASRDKMGPTRAPQTINNNDDKCDRMSKGTKSHAMHNKYTPNGPEDYIEKGNLGPSSLPRGAPNQGKVRSQQTMLSSANDKDNHYGVGKRSGRAHQEQGALQGDNLLDGKIDEERRPSTKSIDAQNPALRSGKVIHLQSEMSVVDEVVGARWRREEASGKVTLQDKEERLWGSERTQNRPATRSKVLTTDSHQDKKSPLQHDQDPDLLLYKRYGQVEDLLIHPMSVRKKPQGRPEEVQATASNYVQKQEVYEEHIPSSKQYNYEQPQQAKHQGKQDTWSAGKERPQNQILHPFAVDQHISPNHPHKPLSNHHEEGQDKYLRHIDREHKKPTAFTSGRHKQDESDSAGMSVNCMSENLTRKPPTMPQRNRPEGAEWNQQYSMYGHQKRPEQEGVAAYNQDHDEKLDRGATPPTRPPPPLPAVIAGASKREQAEKESRAQARRSPEEAKWRKPPSSTPASSDLQNVAHEHPSKSQSSGPASSPIMPAASKMGDASKKPPKLPHVDDLAANLEALRRARFK